MDTVKAKALKAIESLPDDCTWEDVRYRIYLLVEVELGMEDVRAGRVTSHEDFKREIEEWLASTGPDEPSVTSEPPRPTSGTVPVLASSETSGPASYLPPRIA